MNGCRYGVAVLGIAVGLCAAGCTTQAAAETADSAAAIETSQVSVSHAEAARRTLELTESRRTLDYMHEQITPQMFSMLEGMDIKDEHAAMYRRYADKMREFLRQELSWERMEPAMIDIYTRVYTEEELRELNDFYASPTGRKMIERMPLLMEESMLFTQKMVRDFLPRLQRYQEQIHAEILAELEQAGQEDEASAGGG